MIRSEQGIVGERVIYVRTDQLSLNFFKSLFPILSVLDQLYRSNKKKMAWECKLVGMYYVDDVAFEKKLRLKNVSYVIIFTLRKQYNHERWLNRGEG